jgi:acyl-CoA dehydrogenase
MPWGWIKQLKSPVVAGQSAEDVDRQGRFPVEALASFKSERLLSAPIAESLGGMGLSMRGQGELVAAIAQHCGSSAMVLAMHYSQLACLTRHTKGSAFFLEYQRELCEKQWLLGSVTSEVGTFGDTRSSICAVDLEGDQFKLKKEATTGSYCAQADAVLITTRRSAQAQPSDQVLVMVKSDQMSLKQSSAWDTMGMRGTCSPGFSIDSAGPATQIFPEPYSEIASLSMVPYSHTLWAALWWGLSYSAYDKAALMIRGQARKNPGVVPAAATRLAELRVKVQTSRHHWQGVADDFDALVAGGGDAQALQAMGWALTFNSLKTAASQIAPEIVQDALLMLGIPGFNNTGPLSVSRALRDSLSGALMVSNERIAGKSASMLLVYKDN